jgi:hypothetical protein
MTELLSVSGDGSGSGVGISSSSPPPRFSVRAAAFANEATVRQRPGLSRSLSSAGVSLVTVPSTRNAADAMVVSCAAEALLPRRSGSGGGEKEEQGLSGLVFCSADNYFSGFLRYASYKGVRTFVAGDFDNSGVRGRARGGGGGGGAAARQRKSGEKQQQQTETKTNKSSNSSSSSDDEEGNLLSLAPSWRKKELPSAADGAALWSDVLSEARELLLKN